MQGKRRIALAAAVAALGVGGVALANHVPEIDPATVPTGFLSSHVEVRNVQEASFARAVRRGRADLFVQHARLAAGEATPFHTHPGPALVTVVRGALIYEAARGSRCRRTTYEAGSGFMDRGFGHVHRAVAGAEGADFYVTYVLPTGAENHLLPRQAPRPCR
jgi:quercetin dioxygenase-like cupin family protein